MRIFLSAIAFIIVALLVGLVLVKNSNAPNVRNIRMELHPSASAFIDFLSSPVHLKKYFETSEVKPSVIISAFDTDLQTSRKLNEVDHVSRLLNSEVTIRPPRRGGAISATMRLKDPAIVSTFFMPYLAHLQQTYTENWISSFKEIERSATQSEANFIGNLPYAELIEQKTLKSMMSGSPVITAYKAERALHLSLSTIILFSFFSGLLAAFCTYFGHKYRSQIYQHIMAG